MQIKVNPPKFDPEAFPEDCMALSEYIPSIKLEEEGIDANTMKELMVGQVYSPSHFWFYLLGERFHMALEAMTALMNWYYLTDGRRRRLEPGAVQVGHYCSCLYEGEWHRARIVQLIDEEFVKVMYIDYGTVEIVDVSILKPLLRCWAELPAQAIRGRLARVEPSGAGRVWPLAASRAFLRLVQDRRLYGNVIRLDLQQNAVECLLIDTSTDTDVLLHEELIRAGYADPRRELSPPASTKTYFYPRFEALESGVTQSFYELDDTRQYW